MPGSERYFGDTDAFRASGKHLIAAKTVADTKVNDAASFARSSAFVFAHSVLDASITSACEGAVLLKPEQWIRYVENQQVALGDIQSRSSREVTFDRLAGFVRQLSRESIVKRMERLLNTLKPGDNYDGIRDYRLDLATIESYDRTRQDIIHHRKFDIKLDRLEDAITSRNLFCILCFSFFGGMTKNSTNELGMNLSSRPRHDRRRPTGKSRTDSYLPRFRGGTLEIVAGFETRIGSPSPPTRNRSSRRQ